MGGGGLESINSGNVGYYDQGMYAAHARCGGSGCALIVNPPGHRTVNQFHIHFVHYEGYGSSLKQKLEGEVCGKSGWHGGGLPCGGKAAFFSGFPAVFSEAMTAGGFAHASVIAWPASCGGSGTIVELAYGCSIEHQIRGDYDPGTVEFGESQARLSHVERPERVCGSVLWGHTHSLLSSVQLFLSACEHASFSAQVEEQRHFSLVAAASNREMALPG